MNEETTTLVTILRHQKQVSFFLRELAREFERRADLHDMSKLQLDEFEGFVEVNRIARQYAFGSPQYNKSLEDNKAIAFHYSRNPHHPEYYSSGIKGMDLVDFIEMVTDWIAASLTYNTTSWEDAIKEQRKRFGLNDCHLALIRLISEFLFTR